MLTACTQLHRTTMLSDEIHQERYTYAEVEEHAGRVLPKKLIVATFSGGGTRAAALAYGALTGLRDTVSKSSTTPKRRLIDEVDMVSAVSGGSVTAAYWALEGADGLDGLKDNFLERNIHCDLFCKMANPGTLLQLMTPSYARSDVLREIFATLLFQEATYGDLIVDAPTKKRSTNGRPYLILNAMDMTSNGIFPITQTSFSLLCSDLVQFKLADAVSASAAYPGWFTSVPLKNYIDDAGCPVKNTAEAANRTEILTSWIKDEQSNAKAEWDKSREAAENATNQKDEAKRARDESRTTKNKRRQAEIEAGDEVKRRNTALARADEEKRNQEKVVIKAKSREAEAMKELEQVKMVVDVNKQISLYDKAVDARDKAQHRLDKIIDSNRTTELTVNPATQEDAVKLQDEPKRDDGDDLQSEEMPEATSDDVADDVAMANARIKMNQAQVLVDQEKSLLDILRGKIEAKELDLVRAKDARRQTENSDKIATAKAVAAKTDLDKATRTLKQRSREYAESIENLAEAEQVLEAAIDMEEEAFRRKEDAQHKINRIEELERLLKVLKRLEQNVKRISYKGENYRTVHLLDGGVSDNLGLSPLLELLRTILSVKRDLDGKAKLDSLVDQVMVIVVDAGTTSTQNYGRKASPPGLIDTLKTAVGASINSKSVLLRERLESLTADLKGPKTNDEDPKGLKINVVYVGFDEINEILKENGDSTTGNKGKLCEQWFHKIPTNWNLESSAIESVIQLGNALVRDSEEYKNFIKEIKFETNSENSVLDVCTEAMDSLE